MTQTNSTAPLRAGESHAAAPTAINDRSEFLRRLFPQMPGDRGPHTAVDDRPEYLQRLFPKPPPPVGALPPITRQQGEPYARAAVEAELRALASIPEGARNDQLNKASFNLAQLVAAGYLDRQDVEDRLRQTALAIGLNPRETDATIASGSRRVRHSRARFHRARSHG